MATPEPEPPPERRKTPLVQRITLIVDIGILIAIITFTFWSGRQAERIDQVAKEQAKQGEVQAQQGAAIALLGTTVTEVTNQVLLSAETRIAVVEAKGTSTETLVRDLKVDMTDRLRRIEDKIDDKK